MPFTSFAATQKSSGLFAVFSDLPYDPFDPINDLVLGIGEIWNLLPCQGVIDLSVVTSY